MLDDLIRPCEVDRLYCWPAGRAQRLARRGKLPHYVLPNSEIRFRYAEVAALVTPAGPLPPNSVITGDLAETQPPGAGGRP